MAAPKKFPPFVVRSAIAEVRQHGRSISEVSREMGIARNTLSAWLDAKPGDEFESECAAQDDPDEFGEDYEGDTVETLRRLLRSTERRAVAAEKAGNHTAAQRYGRDAGLMANTLTRLERTESEDVDVVKISRREIETAQESVREKIRILSSRPLLCAHCSRELSIETAGAKQIT